MNTYKQLTSQDIIVSPLIVNKSFVFTKSGSSYSFVEQNPLFDTPLPLPSDVGIDSLFGINQDYINNIETTGKDEIRRKVGVYNSIKHLYYSNYLNSNNNGEFPSASPLVRQPDNTLSGSSLTTNYYNYPQSSLQETKYWNTSLNSKIGVVSIPTKLFGDNIEPGTFSYEAPYSSSEFGGGLLYDDGEGNILYSGSIVGNIIYTHGIITLTQTASGLLPDDTTIYGGDYLYSGSSVSSSLGATYGGKNEYFKVRDNWIENFTISPDVTCSFSSSRTLYETQYKVTLEESEFNYTLNPSLITGSNGEVKPLATGSDFTPYITTIGLYNDNQELVAVGKLAKPLATSKTTDTTILINLDRH